MYNFFCGVVCFSSIIHPVLAQPKPSQCLPTVHQSNLLSEFHGEKENLLQWLLSGLTCMRSTNVKLNITLMCRCAWHCLSFTGWHPPSPHHNNPSLRENLDLPCMALLVLSPSYIPLAPLKLSLLPEKLRLAQYGTACLLTGCIPHAPHTTIPPPGVSLTFRE